MTKKLHPIILYYHHPARGLPPLERMIRWWNKFDTELQLIIRTVEKDKSLPKIQKLWEELEIEHIGWLIGPPLADTGEMVLECYDQWKEMSKDLVYATDNPSQVALFVLTFDAQEARENGRVPEEEE